MSVARYTPSPEISRGQRNRPIPLHFVNGVLVQLYLWQAPTRASKMGKSWECIHGDGGVQGAVR